MLKTKLLSYLDIESALFKTSADWSSRSVNYRQNLRAALLTALADHGKFPDLTLSREDEFDLQNLSFPPQLRDHSISISHCPLAGGFVVCPLPDGHVGLDLEDRTKVTHEVVVRMGSEEESLLAPDPALLWAAKEATFKSLLKASQPRALSAVSLTSWYTIEPGLWGFHAQIQGFNSKPVLGLAAFDQNLVVGLAKFTP